MTIDNDKPRIKGPIAWMVYNGVTPNLLMIALMVGGIVMSTKIKKEVFPDFMIDQVTVGIAYPGASPEEVEKGIVKAVEDSIEGLDSIKKYRAYASEGYANIVIELLEDIDAQKAYQDIKQEIDRITTFPEDAEEPQVSLSMHKRGVIDLSLYGDLDEYSLYAQAERVREKLLMDENITQVDIVPERQHWVSIEISEDNLRAYDLTLETVAAKIRAMALELPGGSVRTEAGEILLRMTERRDWAIDFESVPIVSTPDGTELTVGDIGIVRDTFEDANRVTTYDGKNSVRIEVYRVGDQTPIGVSDAVHAQIEEIVPTLPPGVGMAIDRDMSKMYRQRLELLLKNGFLGLCLVLLILGMFLQVRLAFWVMMGIPISFLGGMLFLPFMDVSINMISMFAFIVALGIVVDDAIVAGENIYEYRQRGMSFVDAAIRGAQDVAVPITFSIITNIVAFLPMLFVPGFMGKMFKVPPLTVITVFIISLIEALFILPAHLAHSKTEHSWGITRWAHNKKQRFLNAFDWFVKTIFGSFLWKTIHHRYITVASGFAMLAIVAGYVASGRMGMVLMPSVEGDEVDVTAVLPVGCPLQDAVEVRDWLLASAEQVTEENGGDILRKGISARINENQVRITVYLMDVDIRPFGPSQFVPLWREKTGMIAGLESLKFEATRRGPGSGAELTVELLHNDVPTLEKASTRLAELIADFANAKDIDDGFTPGKRQFDFEMLPEGRSFGLTSSDVARSLRSSFYGASAMRQQRGENEVRVMVRLPEAERVSEFDIEEMLIRTADGREVPLREVAAIKPGRAYTTIERSNGRRAVMVTADVDPPEATEMIKAQLIDDLLPQLQEEIPGLSYDFEGKQADMAESLGALFNGLSYALVAIYFLLAIPFRSYLQPLVVMISIPFGIIGAVIGHWIMDYGLSIISMMGIIALSGVVVNDALVLIVYANNLRNSGTHPSEAIHAAGIRRFRPIMLTTLTTFFGLAPMIFETSMQARFLIPMALSLGYGIVFATTITLLIVPSLYMIIEDLKWLFGKASVETKPSQPAAKPAS